MSQVEENKPEVVTKLEEGSKDVKDTKETEGRSTMSYVMIGLLSVALVLLIYYAYNRFVANASKEVESDTDEPEKDTPVIDFNLRAAIGELRTMQKQVLATLSEAVDV